MSKDGFAALSPFYKIDRIHYSMLTVRLWRVGRSMFDVHQFLFRFDWLFFKPAAALNL